MSIDAQAVKGQNYTISKGNNLWNIAKARYDLTEGKDNATIWEKAQKIAQDNNIPEPGMIIAGKTLIFKDGDLNKPKENFVKEVNYASGKVSTEYTPDETPIKQTTLDSDETPSSIQEYDPKTKKLIKDTSYNYDFDSKKNYISEVMQYDPTSGNMIEQTFYTPDGKIDNTTKYDPSTGEEIKEDSFFAKINKWYVSQMQELKNLKSKKWLAGQSQELGII